ncbi:hypothetical protein ACQKDB_09345 [Planococcus kocurii]
MSKSMMITEMKKSYDEESLYYEESRSAWPHCHADRVEKIQE